MSRRRIGWGAAVAAAVLVAAGGTARPPAAVGVTVTGTVITGDGAPLKDAEVYAENAAGRPLTDPVVQDDFNLGKRPDLVVRTDAAGRYTLNIADADLDGIKRQYKVHFRHPSWHAEYVNLLTAKGAKPVLNVVLPTRTGPRDYPDILHQIAVYQYHFDAAAGDPAATDKAREFRPLVLGIPHPDKPGETPLQRDAVADLLAHPARAEVVRQRLNALYALYGLSIPPGPPAAGGPPGIELAPCPTGCFGKHPRGGAGLFHRR